jgi:site-specific DNA recombinase
LLTAQLNYQMNKRGIRYHRFSSAGQSNCSIEWQDINTKNWFERNQVELVDTFTDEGFSARTFDRPDMVKLNEFIKKHHKAVSFLVVYDFTRFSRKAGEAITIIEKLQSKYGVQIVSVNEGIIYDYNDNDSFLRSSLSFIFGEEENRKRINNIKGGIYTAKKRDRRYIGTAPVGYKNGRDGRKPVLVVDEEKALIIQAIYRAYLNNLPYYIIARDAKQAGLKNTGNSAIQRILTNPLYTGLVHVKAFKNFPEELVEGVHEAIISRTDWNDVQKRIKPTRAMQILHDSFPLRSVLLCHCNKALTGAPSRSRSGKYINYYKCQVSGHNNINAERAHQQLLEVFHYLSLPEHLYSSIKDNSEEIMRTRMKSNVTLLQQKTVELNTTQKKLRSVEEKFILEQMNFDTYQRWHKELNGKCISLKAEIESLGANQEDIWSLMQQQLYKLKYLPELFKAASTLEKQELVKMVFDSKLYYQDKVYRTPYIIPILNHNTLILKEKQLLVLDEKRGAAEQFPLSRAYGNRTRDSSVKGRCLNPLTNAPFSVNGRQK